MSKKSLPVFSYLMPIGQDTIVEFWIDKQSALDQYCELFFDAEPRRKKIYNKLLSECRIFKGSGDKRGIRDGMKINLQPCLNEDLFLKHLAVYISGYLNQPTALKEGMKDLAINDFSRQFKETINIYRYKTIRKDRIKRISKDLIEWRQKALDKVEGANMTIPKESRLILEEGIIETFNRFVPELSNRSIHDHMVNICRCFDIPYPKSARVMRYQKRSKAR